MHKTVQNLISIQSSIKSKINKVTCTFLDTELENEYKKSEWNREKSKTTYIMIALAFLATIGLILEFGTQARWESMGIEYSPPIALMGNWLTFSHFLHISLYLYVLFASDEFKFKYAEKISSLNLSNIINLPIDSISVKATTSEGLGIIGENMAIACKTIILLKKNESV